MITFLRLNDQKATKSDVSLDRSKVTTYDQLKREAETLLSDEERPARVFFMDLESEIAQITDQDDFDYAKSQPVENLVIVVVEVSEDRKGLSLYDAVAEVVKKRTASTEIRPIGNELTEAKEPAKLQPIEQESPQIHSEHSTPQPETSKGVLELGSIITQLHETVQVNIKELAESLSPVTKENPKPLIQSPPINSKPRSNSGLSKDLPNCNNCKKQIKGKRFKCLVCSSYITCNDCETLLNHPHTMVRFNSAEMDTTVSQLSRVYQLKTNLIEMSDADMRRVIIKKVTSSQYPEEFYDEFVKKNQKMTFGEYVNKVVSIFE